MVTARRLYIILALALSVAAISISVVILWTNLNHNKSASNGEREVNDQEPGDSGGLGSSIHFPNPLRMLASSLSSDRVASPPPVPAREPPVRYEERHIYLVDMMDCNKTFAALKYKLWLRVPEKTPASMIDLEKGSKSTILNKTLVDCFLVDTEKRFEQKVQMEERYKRTVTTRLVPHDVMIDAIEECTKLVELMSPEKMTIVKVNEPSNNGANNSNNIADPNQNQNQNNTRTSFFNLPHTIASSSFFENILANALAPIEPQHAAASSNQADQQPRAPQALTRQQQQQHHPNYTSTSKIIGNTNHNGTRGLSNYVSAGVSMISGIVPNTLWCGLGDRARNYSELGTEFRIDACCRAHDHCPIRLRPFSSDYGLMNWSVSTRSHCDCDVLFNECLAQVNSTLANVIRVIYFRFVGLQCIEFGNQAELKQLEEQQQLQLQPQPLLQSQSQPMESRPQEGEGEEAAVTQANNEHPRAHSFLSSASEMIFG